PRASPLTRSSTTCSRRYRHHGAACNGDERGGRRDRREHSSPRARRARRSIFMTTSQAIPGARFVDPKILSRIGNLELMARSVVEGFINGLHRAPFFGASIDFAEHRGYVAGDDIRRVDWRLYARTDRYYVKQYE